MAIAAFIALLAICLTAERGWFGDFAGQAVLGLMFGGAVGEAFRRSLCLLLHNWGRRIPSAWAPLLLFVFHVYALTHVGTIYVWTIVMASVIGFAGFIALAIFDDLCQGVVESMNEFMADISHKGG